MSNIINRSNHPVEIKRVELHIWKLRDEIESAIQRRMEEQGETDQSKINIDDIKEYYLKILEGGSTPSEERVSTDDDEDGLDSSGNPMDDDAMAMMAALGGGATEGDEAEAEATAEEVPEESPEETAEDAPDDGDAQETEEDDAAAALAAQMLADQGLAPAADEATEPTQENQAATEQAPESKNGPYKRVPPHSHKIVEGFVFLSDIQMDQIMIFAKDNFIHGQNIVIKFLVPQTFSVTAEIIASTNIARNSKIISQVKPDYRLQALFRFKFPGERGTLRDFLTSIEPDIPEPPKKLKRPDSDDDDDFDDLGF